MQDTKIWPYQQLVYTQTRICLRKWNIEFTGFWDTNRSPNSSQMTRSCVCSQKEKKNLSSFIVPLDHRMKMKEHEKINKYLNLARELKKLWNMKATMTVILVVVSMPRTVSKGLEKRLKELEIRKKFKLFRLQHCKDQLEYSEESWRPQEMYYD